MSCPVHTGGHGPVRHRERERGSIFKFVESVQHPGNQGGRGHVRHSCCDLPNANFAVSLATGENAGLTSHASLTA